MKVLCTILRYASWQISRDGGLVMIAQISESSVIALISESSVIANDCPKH